MGPGTGQRLALEEAAALSWWTGDRVGADRLALWISYRIGAVAEDGGGLIRTAWAARRLAATPARGVRAAVADLSGEDRGDPVLAEEVEAVLQAVMGLSPVTRGCVAFHLWRRLDERPEHLRGLEAAVLGDRLAGQGGLAFLPLALTGFGALTASGEPMQRLAAWVQGGTEGGADRPDGAGAVVPVARAGRDGDGRPLGPHAGTINRGTCRPPDAGRRRGRGRDGPPCSATLMCWRRAAWCARSRGRGGSGSGRRSSRRRTRPLWFSALSQGKWVPEAGRHRLSPESPSTLVRVR